jgi:hypothetical protein
MQTNLKGVLLRRAIEALPKYGPINPVNDLRSFCREMVPELLDALNYCQ